VPMRIERRSTVKNSWTGKLVRSLETRGLVETAKLAASSIAFRIRLWLPDWWDNYVQWRFDRKYGVETRGEVRLPELHADPRYQHALHYGTCSRFSIRRMLKSLPIEHREFTFVDMGCGKGKALLVASEWPFRQIIGVELSPALLGVAERNVATYRGKKKGCRSFRLICADARDYEIPLGNALLYFFNPFREPLLSAVIENVGRSVAQSPREVYVIYKYPQFRAMMDALPFLRLVRESAWYRIYRVVPERTGIWGCPNRADSEGGTGTSGAE